MLPIKPDIAKYHVYMLKNKLDSTAWTFLLDTVNIDLSVLGVLFSSISTTHFTQSTYLTQATLTVSGQKEALWKHLVWELWLNLEEALIIIISPVSGR